MTVYLTQVNCLLYGDSCLVHLRCDIKDLDVSLTFSSLFFAYQYLYGSFEFLHKASSCVLATIRVRDNNDLERIGGKFGQILTGLRFELFRFSEAIHRA